MNNPNKKIFLVDDDKVLNRLLHINLENHGYKVESIFSSYDLFSKISISLPHLIILDNILPDENGYEVILKLRKNNITKNIPIIMLSSDDSNELKNQISDIGVDCFLLKPVKVKELIQQIMNLTGDENN